MVGIVKRRRLQDPFQRQSYQAHEMARLDPPRLHCTGKLEKWAGPTPNQSPRCASSPDRLARHYHCGIGPLGTVSHPISVRASCWISPVSAVPAWLYDAARYSGIIPASGASPSRAVGALMRRREFLIRGGIVSAGLFGTGNAATSLLHTN